MLYVITQCVHYKKQKDPEEKIGPVHDDSHDKDVKYLYTSVDEMT